MTDARSEKRSPALARGASTEDQSNPLQYIPQVSSEQQPLDDRRVPGEISFDRQVEARLKEAKLERRRARRRLASLPPFRRHAWLRVYELETVFAYRWGYQLPDDDAGRDEFELLANHLANTNGDVHARIMSYARRWAPWMPLEEVQRLADRAIARPEMYVADRLADLLNVNYELRTKLALKTIGATDVRKEDRLILRRKKKAQAAHLARIRQAEKEGRTLRPRRGRPRKNPCPVSLVINAVHEFPAPASAGGSDPYQDRIGTVPAGGRDGHRRSGDRTQQGRPSPNNPSEEVRAEAKRIVEEMPKNRGLLAGWLDDHEVAHALRAAWKANPLDWRGEFSRQLASRLKRKEAQRLRKARAWSRNQFFKHNRMPGLGQRVMLEMARENFNRPPSETR